MTFRPSSLNLIYIIPLCLVLVGIPKLLEYLSTKYIFQDGIFEEQKGLLFKQSISIPAHNIDNIQVKYFGFFRGIGKIIIETPGENDNDISTTFWINNPNRIRNILLAQ